MGDLERRLRTALLAPVVEGIDEHAVLSDVARKVVERRRRRRRHQLAATITALALVLAGTGIGVLIATSGTATVNSSPQRGHVSSPILDPRLGPGGFTVTPNTNLANGQVVTVSLHGFRPGAGLIVTMCRGTPTSIDQGNNQCVVGDSAYINNHGKATVRLAVQRFIVTASVAGAPEWDCAAYPGACSVAVGLPSGTKLIGNLQPLTFSPYPPAPTSVNPRQISVSPPPPFIEGEQVTITGTGFSPNVSVQVGECPTDSDCGAYVSTVETDGSGRFSAPVTVQQSYTFGVEERNCALPLTCFFIASDVSPPYAAAPAIPLTMASPSG